MKLVSTKTRYGGPNAVLYLKKSADETFGLNYKDNIIMPKPINKSNKLKKTW